MSHPQVINSMMIHAPSTLTVHHRVCIVCRFRKKIGGIFFHRATVLDRIRVITHVGKTVRAGVARLGGICDA